MHQARLEHRDELFVAVGVSAVAGLEVGKTAQVVLLGEGVGGLLGDHDVVAEAVGVGGGVAHAHVGVEARHDDRLHAELAQQDVEVGLEEAAVAALRHHVVGLGELELGDDLGAGGTGDGVVAPDLKLAVDALDVGVVAEDHGHARLTRRVEERGGGGHDGLAAVARKGARHEVIEHVDHEDRRFVQLHLGLPFCSETRR